ncbi:MAG TPA: hypothetical protein VFQ62_06745 [Methylomirabilota bacterium]|nr:hypothetical protein [Methylomirabilota bacterium]
MRFLIFAVVTAALVVPAQAEERAAAAAKPTLAAQGRTILATPEYSQRGGWQARVSQNRGIRGSRKKAIIIGAAAGAAAGFVTGLVLEQQACRCGPGAWSALGAGIGAGSGAAVGWGLSVR